MPIFVVIENDGRNTPMGGLTLIVTAVLLIVMMNGPM